MQVPAEMMDGVIESSQCMGLQKLGAGGTFEPVELSAKSARNVGEGVVRTASNTMNLAGAEEGIAAMSLCGGQEHPQVAALGFSSVASTQTGAELVAMGPKKDPGRSR